MSASGLNLKPIVLFPVRPRQAADTSSASRIPSRIPVGLYESVHGTRASTQPKGPIPPLAYFCIRTLINYPDQVYPIGSHRIRCQPEVLSALSPSTFIGINTIIDCLCKLDPRIWSILAQVYFDLPYGLQDYYIPLGDKHLPLLQAIPPTPSFALITVLNLAGRVSDEESHALKFLHGLCALDISDTSISHLGIRHFAPAVTTEQSDQLYGTRGLRILRLNNCRKITNQVIDALTSFPLLAILDLRGTSCHDLDSDAFRRSKKSQRKLFQCSLQDALQRLRDSDPRNILFSHPDPFVIHINTEFYPCSPQRPASTSISQPLHDDQISEAERELRAWICSELGDAATETRISEITDFVTERWSYDPRWPDERYDSDSGWEDEDSIDSWDEDSSTERPILFCGYTVDKDLEERVFELVSEAIEDHESAIRFYGLDSRTPNTVACHCERLRRAVKSSAETMPVDQELMLFRDPPEWNSVYGPEAPPPRRIRPATNPPLSSSYLNPDRSGARAKKSTQEMLDMITQRRSSSNATIPPSLSSIPTVSNNPFKKSSAGALARGELRGLHQGSADSARGENSDYSSPPNGPTPKRMKAISQIPVPLRPIPPTRSRAARARSDGTSGILQKKSGKLKQTSLAELFGKRT